MPLHTILRDRLKISDDEFSKESRRFSVARPKVAIHRTEVWRYRMGKQAMSAERALQVLRTLRHLGIVLSFEELLGEKRRAA